MLWALIEFGGILFWLFVAAFLVFETVMVTKDLRWWAAVSLVAFLAFLQLFTTFNLIQFVADNWMYCLYALGAYFMVGIAWGFVKWESFIGKRKSDFDELKRRFLEDRRVSGKDIPAEMQTQWSVHVINHFKGVYASRTSESDLVYNWTPDKIKTLITPSARNEKSRLMTWMAYWPFSLLSTLLCDIILDTWNWIYSNLHQVFQYRAAARFAGVESEFGIPPRKTTQDIAQEYSTRP